MIWNVWFSLPICTEEISWIISAVCLTNYDCGVLPHGMFSLIDYLRNSWYWCRVIHWNFLHWRLGLLGSHFPMSQFVLFFYSLLRSSVRGNMPWGVHIADGICMCVQTYFFMRLWEPFIALLSDAKLIWGLFCTSPELKLWAAFPLHFFWANYVVCLSVNHWWDECNNFYCTCETLLSDDSWQYH